MTTWAEMLDQLREELAAAPLNASQMLKGNEQVTFRTAKQLQEMIDLITTMQGEEEGTADTTTYAQRVRI